MKYVEPYEVLCLPTSHFSVLSIYYNYIANIDLTVFLNNL